MQETLEIWVWSLGRTPWRRAWWCTPIFFPGESHGQRSLVGYGSWESDTTEGVSHTCVHASTQYSQLNDNTSHSLASEYNIEVKWASIVWGSHRCWLMVSILLFFLYPVAWIWVWWTSSRSSLVPWSTLGHRYQTRLWQQPDRKNSVSLTMLIPTLHCPYQRFLYGREILSWFGLCSFCGLVVRQSWNNLSQTKGRL